MWHKCNWAGIFTSLFVEAICCEMVHFLEFNRRRDLWEFFCYGPRGRMNTWLFLSKLTGIARRGVLKELEVCDFENNWSACQWDDGSCCDKFSEFLMFWCFLIIRQNVNMATSAILYSDLTPPGGRHKFTQVSYFPKKTPVGVTNSHERGHIYPTQRVPQILCTKHCLHIKLFNKIRQK